MVSPPKNNHECYFLARYIAIETVIKRYFRLYLKTLASTCSAGYTTFSIGKGV